MKQFIFIFVSITSLNLQATDLTDKLKGCLEDKRDQINQEKEIESLKAVSSCLTDFVKKLESKSQAKTEVTNNTSIQFNLQSMYPISSQNYFGFVDFTSNTPSPISKIETSNVPPPSILLQYLWRILL